MSDDELKVLLKHICRMGFYIEPASAATTAAIEKYVSRSDPPETVVSVLTGHGLKATEEMRHL